MSTLMELIRIKNNHIEIMMTTTGAATNSNAKTSGGSLFLN